MALFMEVLKHSVDPVTGYNTFIVRAVEENEEGNKVGPETPIGISSAALDAFGGHEEEHLLAFLESKKPFVLDAFIRTCKCAEHTQKLVGRKL